MHPAGGTELICLSLSCAHLSPSFPFGVEHHPPPPPTLSVSLGRQEDATPRVMNLGGLRPSVFTTPGSSYGDNCVVIGFEERVPVQVWNMVTCRKVMDFAGNLSANSLITLSSGRIAAGGHDGDRDVIVIYNAETGERILELNGHRDRIFGLAYDAEGGHLILASCNDKQLRVWRESSWDKVRDVRVRVRYRQASAVCAVESGCRLT